MYEIALGVPLPSNRYKLAFVKFVAMTVKALPLVKEKMLEAKYVDAVIVVETDEAYFEVAATEPEIELSKSFEVLIELDMVTKFVLTELDSVVKSVFDPVIVVFTITRLLFTEEDRLVNFVSAELSDVITVPIEEPLISSII